MTQIVNCVNDYEKMVTIPELGKLGIIPGRAARRLVKDGLIPSVQVGNRKYVKLKTFLEFLDGKRD
ncbi:MAG: helix-turn-helix domain-containing protein [Firmicutes bacterium]|nr:helix-turn-helix domain-containing protein [Bacillota bacterium]